MEQTKTDSVVTGEAEQQGGVTLVRAPAIHTRRGEVVEALVVGAGKVLAAGDAADLASRYAVSDKVELTGHLFPGFNDAHAHPVMAADQLLRVDCSPSQVQGVDALASALRAGSSIVAADEWVVGTRFDDMKSLPGAKLDRWLLDSWVADHPVLVVHLSGHWGVLNSRGLERAGLDRSSTAPPGGQLARTSSGELDGVVHEQALFDIAYPAMARGGRAVIPSPSIEQRTEALNTVLRMFGAAGITSVCDALCGPGDLALLQSLKRRGELDLRVNVLMAYQYLDDLAQLGVQSGLGDSNLRVLGIKMFLDGACAGATCWVDEPFVGTSSHGIQTMSQEDVLDVIQRATDAGIVVGTHANGDRAIRLLVDSHEKVARRRPWLRHRIEHCSIIDDDILARMQKLGLVAVPLGSYPRFQGERLLGSYGHDRLERMFAHRSFIDNTIPVAGSSDYPCAPLDPLYSIASCVERMSENRLEVGLSQRISVAEAIDLYTVGSAYSTGEESVKGRLVPGHLADFVELAQDPAAVAAESIPEIQVLSTWVGGRQIYSSGESSVRR